MVGLASKLMSGNKTSSHKTTFRPRFEPLEERELMSATSLAAGTGLTNTNVNLSPGGAMGLQPTPAGLALINGLADTPVKSAALADYQQHGSITRNDMIDIFFKGTTGFTDLTTSEAASLRTLVTNGTTLLMPAYVQNLASKVLAGNGLSSAQALQTRVDNFFLGQAHPDGSSYFYFSSPLWNSSGPSYKDVSERSNGGLGNGNDAGPFNWMMSSLSDVASRDPAAITNMIIDNGDNTYTVRLYHGGTPDYVTVDRYLDADLNISQAVMWPNLVLKAYAQENVTGWLGSPHPGVDSLNALAVAENDGLGSNVGGGNPTWALAAITGLPTTYVTNVSPDAICTAWSQGHFIVLHTTDDYNAAGIYNPKASDYLNPRGWYALVNYNDGWFTVAPQLRDGITSGANIEVAASVLANNFERWGETTAAPPAPTGSAAAMSAPAPQTVAATGVAPPASAQLTTATPNQSTTSNPPTTATGNTTLTASPVSEADATALAAAKKTGVVSLLNLSDAVLMDIFGSCDV